MFNDNDGDWCGAEWANCKIEYEVSARELERIRKDMEAYEQMNGMVIRWIIGRDQLDFGKVNQLFLNISILITSH